MTREARKKAKASPPVPRRRSPRARGWLLAFGLLAAALVFGFWWLRPARRPNVLLITIDTLRADHVGAYGYRAGATPVLDGLAARGTLFTDAICQVPLTLPSHASMLTGLLPPSHGIRDNVGFALPASVPTIAEQFRNAGYATAAFVSGYPLHRRFGLARGFDRYDDRFPRGDDPARAPYVERRADQTVHAAIEWLSQIRGTPDRPFFAWVHLFDPHAPYDPPEPFRTRFHDRPYDGEIAFADSQIGVLLDDLSTRGELANTVVLAVADHGESLGEHGEPTHGLFIYDSTVRIPLIAAGPGVRSGARVAAVARAMDVAPTLLDLARLRALPRMDGRSLTPALQGREMAPEGAYVESLFARLSFGWAPLYGWRTGQTMYIDAPRPEVYDLVADPGQQRDLSAQRSTEVARYNGIVRAIAARATSASNHPAPREARERLGALGYTSGASATIGNPSLRDPKDFAALAVRAEKAITFELSNPALAAEEFRAILQNDPANGFARQHLAAALTKLRRFDEALVETSRMIDAGDRSGDTFVLRGECYRVLGRYDAALDAFSEAAARDPLAADPMNGRGRTLVLAGRREEARQAFAAALRLAPDDPDALTGLADLAIERGDMVEARQLLETLRARDGADASATLKLGVLLVRSGDLDGAIALFREIVASQPSNADAVVDLGGALAKAGRPAEAVPYFERAIAAGAENVIVWNSLAMARLQSGNQAGAVDALRRSLRLKPEQPDIAALLQKLETR